MASTRSVATWINEGFAASLGPSKRAGMSLRHAVEDMLFPERRRARERASAAEWLTYYLATGADGGQALSDVLGNGLARGYDGPLLAKVVDLMGIEVEDRYGECFLKLPADHPYRIEGGSEE